MFSVYDRCKNIIFNDGKTVINFNSPYELQDFDDYIIIKTAVTIENVDRGWRGDVTFSFAGYDVNGSFENGHSAFENVTLKDMLCSARIFNQYDNEAVTWEYKLLKY
jgi:hypothetical protein